MPRSRIVKPDFFKHAALFEAERASGLPLRLAYEGLWCVADRAGRFAWKPRELKLDVLPYDDVEFATVLDALAAHGFVRRYEAEGRVYGEIPTLVRHQTFHHREAASKLPPPPRTSPSIESGPSVAPDHPPSEPPPPPAAPGARPGKAQGKPRSRPTVSVSVTGSVSDKRSTRSPSADARDPGGDRASGSAPEPASGAKYPNFPRSARSALFSRWVAVRGTVDFGFFVKTLAPLYPQTGPLYTDAELAAAIDTFAAWVQTLPLEKAKYDGRLTTFAENVVEWVRLGRQPVTDVNGITERGRIVTAERRIAG